MNKKKIIAGVALMAIVGVAATVAAQGHRDWHGRGAGMGDRMGGGMGTGPDGGMGGMRGPDGFGPGRFGRDLTKDEFDTRTRERFARLDKNSDGVIDATEIEAAIAEGMSRRRGRLAGGPGQPGAGAPQPAEQMLRRLGADKDGKLTKQAFLDRMKARFAEADLNNDGKITDEDLPPLMRGRGLISVEGIRNGRLPLFRMLRDAEVKDGGITLDAALAAATKQFDRMDRDKNGVVEQADFAAMRREMVDYQVKRFVHRYGADKDGKVTKEQFFAKAAQQFAEADFNGDGLIGRSERGGRPGFGERMRQRFMGPRDGSPGGPVPPTKP